MSQRRKKRLRADVAATVLRKQIGKILPEGAASPMCLEGAVREAMGVVRVVLLELLCAALAHTAWMTTPPSARGAAAAPRQLSVLRKCCPLDHLLDDKQGSCVPVDNATRQRLNITSFQEREPWWMDANVHVAPSREIKRLSALALNAKVLYKKQPCERDLMSVLWASEVSIYLNGSLEMQLDTAAVGPSQKFVLPPEDYCMDMTTLRGRPYLAFHACPCKHVVCVRKCCDNKRMLTISEAVAMKQNAHCAAKLPKTFVWRAPFTGRTAGSEVRQANVSFARLRGPIYNTCPSGRANVIIDMSDKFQSKLLPNGRLIAGITGSPFSTHQFCVDYGKDNMKDGYFAYVCAKIHV